MAAVLRAPVGRAIEMLRVLNPSRNFHSDVVKRILKKYKIELYGEDGGLHKLMDLGEEIKAGGGVFDYDLNDEMRVIGIYFQMHLGRNDQDCKQLRAE